MLPETQPRKPMSVARSTNKNPKCDAPEAKRIVIVDDHPITRQGLRAALHEAREALERLPARPEARTR